MYIDRETIIHLGATLFVLGTIGFSVALSLRIWQKRPRKRIVVKLAPVSLTPEQEADLITVLNVLDRVVTTLEQDETYQREQALGNEVVRLEQDECGAVWEAWEIIAREMAK